MPSFLLAQISDPHIGADWGGDGTPDAGLAAAVAAVSALDPRPGALLVSGDVAEHAAAAEYDRARELLARAGIPVHVLPGNHDDRAALRSGFGLAGNAGEPVQYAVDLGPLRLVALDSTRPGEDGGALDGARLAWLDEALADVPGTPTVIALHHPPLVGGIPAMDAIGLPASDRVALAAVVRYGIARCCGFVAGHFHRTITGRARGAGRGRRRSEQHRQGAARLRSAGDRPEAGPSRPASRCTRWSAASLTHVQAIVAA